MENAFEKKPIELVDSKIDSLQTHLNNTLNKMDDILKDLKEIKECLKRMDEVPTKDDSHIPHPKSKGWFYS